MGATPVGDRCKSIKQETFLSLNVQYPDCTPFCLLHVILLLSHIVCQRLVGKRTRSLLKGHDHHHIDCSMWGKGGGIKRPDVITLQYVIINIHHYIVLLFVFEIYSPNFFISNSIKIHVVTLFLLK